MARGNTPPDLDQFIDAFRDLTTPSDQLVENSLEQTLQKVAISGDAANEVDGGDFLDPSGGLASGGGIGGMLIKGTIVAALIGGPALWMSTRILEKSENENPPLASIEKNIDSELEEAITPPPSEEKVEEVESENTEELTQEAPDSDLQDEPARRHDSDGEEGKKPQRKLRHRTPPSASNTTSGHSPGTDHSAQGSNPGFLPPPPLTGKDKKDDNDPSKKSKKVPEADLQAELKAFQDIRSQMRRGNFKRAYSLIQRHRKKYPKSAFREERSFSELACMCELGKSAEAKRLHWRLRIQYPSRLPEGSKACP